ncbi:MAG: hypothetical protein E6772_18005 [Dysgonomonas sp.]|nr:hypothetical protein [Dysgonomonas sp.]
MHVPLLFGGWEVSFVSHYLRSRVHCSSPPITDVLCYRWRTAPHMVIARYLATETRLLAWMIELEPKNTAMRSPDRKLRNSDYICTHPNLTG